MAIAIIDGDILCYDACSPRWRKKAVDGVVTQHLDANGNRVPFEFTPEEDREYLEECWENLLKLLEELKSKLFCKEHIMAVKGTKEFRCELYPEYKANRKKRDPSYASQTRVVPELRKLLVLNDLAIAAQYREADDYVRIWAIECRKAGIPYFVCSIDKDLKCIPGKYYHMKSKKVIEISEIEASRHYYEQLLKGDPTDNIPGIPGVGDKTAKSLVSSIEKDSDFQEIGVERYIEYYGDDWYPNLLLNAKLIHIQRHLEDWFSLEEWPVVQDMKRYGLI